MTRRVLKTLRRAMLPRGTRCRRIRVGIAAGMKCNVDFAYDTSFYLGLHERELNPEFRGLIRPGDRCFDIGGYRGWTALMMTRLSGAPLVVFEGTAANTAVITANAAPNDVDITVEHVLVGNRDGEGWTTLDTAAARHFMPDFIKMDIEGGEVEALLGAERILRERGPAMIVEVHGRDREEACLGIIRRHGYEPRIVNQRRRLLREERWDDENRWFVCEARS